jgi:hypothetical protein
VISVRRKLSGRRNASVCLLRKSFLHAPTTGKNSYICAIAESSEGGTNEAGDYVLILADCHHAIELEFSLVNPKEREESLAKVDTLAEVLNRFREALHSEAKAIEIRNCR